MLMDWLKSLRTWWRGGAAPDAAARNRLERIVLTDGVSRTLFDDFQDHRRSSRGAEEIGWLLLGHREGNNAVALAALPAGTQRDAGVAHVQFHSDVQELASHILRGDDRRLTIVGVVHTHPGSMRQPSGGDLQGDRLWVGQLRGGEGAFAIGTADAHSEQPAEHQQRYGELCFSWYALAETDTRYRPLRVQVTIGADLAKPMRAAWNLIETHARCLNRLFRQLAKVRCEVTQEQSAPVLAMCIVLPEQKQCLRLLLNGTKARYYWDRDGELLAIDPREPQVDRAVFMILAELANTPARAESESLVES
jgi:proteasome lid subunit RPN8/RPN11